MKHYVKTPRCFYRKLYHFFFFFSNVGKNENEPELNLRDFRRKSLEDYIDVTFILHLVTTRVSKFTQHKFGIEI